MSYNINKNSHYFAQMHLRIIPLSNIGFYMLDDSKYYWVECEIIEDFYKVDEGYKVTLRPLNPYFTSEDFYQEDFKSLIEDGYIIEKISEDMNIHYDRWIEELTSGAYLVHEGYYVE